MLLRRGSPLVQGFDPERDRLLYPDQPVSVFPIIKRRRYIGTQVTESETIGKTINGIRVWGAHSGILCSQVRWVEVVGSGVMLWIVYANKMLRNGLLNFEKGCERIPNFRTATKCGKCKKKERQDF